MIMVDNERSDIALAIQDLTAEVKATNVKIDTVVSTTNSHATKLDIVFDPVKGLYPMVGRNTTFRKAMSKGMWLICSGIAGIIFYLIKESFK